jgi:hypothetical protein
MICLHRRCNERFHCKQKSSHDFRNAYARRSTFAVRAILLYISLLDLSMVEAFSGKIFVKMILPVSELHQPPVSSSSRFSLSESPDTERSVVDDDVVVAWLEDDTSAIREPESEESSPRQSKWGSKFQIKESVIRAGQEKAIRNKQKRSSDLDRKRRMCSFLKMLEHNDPKVIAFLTYLSHPFIQAN